VLAVLVAASAAAACGASSAPSASTSTSTSTSSGAASSASTPTTAGHDATTVTSTGPVDPAAIPLGDGYVSTTPKVGYVDSCVTSFPSVGGSSKDGPCIVTYTKTWNSLTKIGVGGSVSWPQATFSVTVSGNRRIITGNDLPVGHDTGTFPIASSDPAYAYDQNPNTITAQSVSWSLPLDPAAAAAPSCLGLGPIGILDDGVYLFDALDGEGRDAAAHEVLDDQCQEHPQMGGVLHHHTVPSCLLAKATGRSTLVGYAADGYGIYVERDASGALLTNTDLDACHGRTSEVLWNGKEQVVYHYDATLEYPYTVGCYHGTATGQSG
jgi:hypothetical protein